MLLSWLIPGFGFLINGRWIRAAWFFILLQATFLAGAYLFKGSVLMPEFRMSSEGFNLVTILTFFTQLFNGGLSLISLLPELANGRLALLPYEEAHQWADLGSFYLLVSGGMNYYVMISTYDHFYRKNTRNPSENQPVTKPLLPEGKS